MKIATAIARVLLGLLCVVVGSHARWNYLAKFRFGLAADACYDNLLNPAGAVYSRAF